MRYILYLRKTMFMIAEIPSYKHVIVKYTNPLFSGARNLMEVVWRKVIHESKMLTSY